MGTEREITQIGGRFLMKPLKGTLRSGYNGARMFGLLLLILGVGMVRPCVQAESNATTASWRSAPTGPN